MSSLLFIELRTGLFLGLLLDLFVVTNLTMAFVGFLLQPTKEKPDAIMEFQNLGAKMDAKSDMYKTSRGNLVTPDPNSNPPIPISISINFNLKQSKTI